ncbi:putative conserved protein YloU, alkaline shock protein (Asp23) family [Streptoalloteichus tenebrarius]|uniref:Conserved protein YloU, alkaline shock protein (Asp23) family n=1 Tax=Streptoalloteichus tenebrarius (strain ATCC 17920 / DSM 40477 / JCM 4838 / CBS 697.72 / NBRC 16177 / NCIMB 11028 / NRRL B-12390 / A12253. 1 / ISP 5477) TaxID=1933 RepID=A0ABT1HS42_STRSD|nr:hypothetical protein [Streptoalloteichus tenebrarius]MCP2258331.1 putative conserved protein YloU, alkaline shock protein (Asp23) family [Streptoalloteichus tenebrarius]BFF03497.1 hypothetical protein GCM10020241_51720 [Streptoalloteichus tenebrarius]
MNGTDSGDGTNGTNGTDGAGATGASGASGEDLAEAIARAVTEHPAVAHLDGGPHGVIASYLPGRRVVGVRAEGRGAPVEVGVVLRWGQPLPKVADELRERVRALAGPVPVDVTVTGVTAPSEGDETDGSGHSGHPS